MKGITYVEFDAIEPTHVVPLLNKPTTREHLVDHALFDESTVQEWIQDKVSVNLTPGCRVRVVLVDAQLAGWCGIQLEAGRPEIAIVLDKRY